MSYPRLPEAKFQECWDALTELAFKKNALLVSNCLTSRIVHEIDEELSSGLIPFSARMIAAYHEFAELFKQALQCYYKALKKRSEVNDLVDICKGVLYESADKKLFKDCTVVKCYYVLKGEEEEGEDSIQYILDKIKHKMCSETLICEFYMDKFGKVLQVLFCYAMED